MSEASERVNEILGKIIDAIGAEVEFEIKEEDGAISVDAKSEEPALLIGRDGNTLSAIEFLLNIIANRGLEGRIKVYLDIEGYKEKRKKVLEEVAFKAAKDVEAEQKTVALEPMSPYERRIIHMALRDSTAVQTESKGEDPVRYVVVKPL